jgi:hypothetical protein
MTSIFGFWGGLLCCIMTASFSVVGTVRLLQSSARMSRDDAHLVADFVQNYYGCRHCHDGRFRLLPGRLMRQTSIIRYQASYSFGLQDLAKT